MKLDNNWHIKYIPNNVVLVHTEKHDENKNDSVEEYFYPNVKVALKNYLNKSLSGSKAILEIVNKIESVEKLIKTL